MSILTVVAMLCQVWNISLCTPVVFIPPVKTLVPYLVQKAFLAIPSSMSPEKNQRDSPINLYPTPNDQVSRTHITISDSLNLLTLPSFVLRRVQVMPLAGAVDYPSPVIVWIFHEIRRHRRLNELELSLLACRTGFRCVLLRE